MEETEEQRIQRLVKEEINKTKENDSWRKYKDGCYKIFPYILAFVIIYTIFSAETPEKGIGEIVVTLFGLALGLGFWSIVAWGFKIRDSNPKIDSTRVAYKIMRIIWVSSFIVGLIIGAIKVLSE